MIYLNQYPINAQMAYNHVNTALGQLQQAGQITAAEAQTLANCMANNEPQIISFLQKAGQAYSYQVDDNTMYNWTYNALYNAAVKLRQPRTVVNSGPVYTVQNGVAPTWGQTNNGVMYVGQQQGFQSNSALREVYGSPQQQQQQVAIYSSTPTPTQNADPVARSPQQPAMKTVMPSNKPLNMEVWEPLAPQPLDWTEGRNPFGEGKTSLTDGLDADEFPVDTVREDWSDFKEIKTPEQETIVTAKHVITETLGNPIEAVEDMLTNSAAAMTGKYVHVVTYNEALPIVLAKNQVENCLDKCHRALRENKGLQRVLAAFEALKSCPEAFRNPVTEMIVKKFNEAAAVSFVKKTSTGGISRLPTLNSLAEISRLLVDGGDEWLKEWRTDETNYSIALRNCLNASIFRVFHKGIKLVLDPKNTADKLIIAAKSTVRVKGKKLQAALLDNPDDATKKEIDTALRTTSVITIQRKILVTNVDLCEIDKESSAPQLLPQTYLANVMKHFVKKHGVLEVVDVREPDLDRIRVVGEIYGDVLVRRV